MESKGKTLREIFEERDWVVFSQGFNSGDPSELQNWLPLPPGYLGQVKAIEDEFIQVDILHPLADVYIRIKVYFPESTKTRDPQRTDSLAVIRKKKL